MSQRVRGFGLWLWLVACALIATAPLNAQQLGLTQSPILTIDSNRLFTDSAFGRRVAREVEADSAVLSAENRRIEAELIDEERDLTTRRPAMEPEAFRVLADAFDEKVQAIRREQDEKGRVLNLKKEASQVMFFNAARPILEALMQDARASVILERSTVFLSANVSDVTDLAIERIDAAFGEGPETLPGALDE